MKAKLVFVDETGFSLVPSVANTWGIRGETPVLHHRMSWPKLSVISAVTTNPHIYTRLIDGSVRSKEVIQFVQHLLRQIPGKIILVWDRLSAHKSKQTRAALKEYGSRLTVYEFPPYAPELNPDEYVWTYMKTHGLQNYCPRETSWNWRKASSRRTSCSWTGSSAATQTWRPW